MSQERDPDRPLVALRPLARLSHVKAWTVFYADRSVPMPSYEEAQDWARWLTTQQGQIALQVFNRRRRP